MKRFLNRPHAPAILFLSFWTVYFALFWSRAIGINDQGGLTVGHLNIWGDWAIHFTMGSSMAYRQLFLEQNPLLINSAFRYPFFANLVSALLIRLGVPFFTAFTVPSFVFSIFTAAALYAFYRVVLGSQKLAVAAATIYLANGGIGFLSFIKDVFTSRQPFHTLFLPPQIYTRVGDLQWINVVHSMLIPQRSFQLGFPMALTLLAILYRWWGAGKKPPANLAAPAVLGLWFGFLPIVHAHAFAASGLVIAFGIANEAVTRARPWSEILRWWGMFFGVAALVATPIILFYFSSAGSLSGFRWAPGWFATEQSRNWFVFWWRNWGATPFVAVAGFAWCLSVRQGVLCESRERRIQALFFAAPFAFFFAIGNLFIVHPWIWDNTKVFAWASVGISGFAAVFIHALWTHETRLQPAARVLAAVLFSTMIASGAIDLYRLQLPQLNRQEMYSNEDLYLADWVKKNTPVESIWLTGNHHNHFLFNLTGRQSLMTYPGWLWTQGYNFSPVENDIREMYQNPGREDLLRKYQVDYVVMGPYEKKQFNVSDRFAGRFPVAVTTDQYTIYQIRGIPPKLDNVETIDRLDAIFPLTATLQPGLLERIYRGKYFFGRPRVKKDVVDLNFHYDATDPKPFSAPVSIEWDGYLKVPFEGGYRFTLASDDAGFLAIDGRLLIDNGGVHGIQEASSTVTLGSGYHRLKLRYFDVGGGATFSFGWSRTPGSAPRLEADALFH